MVDHLVSDLQQGFSNLYILYLGNGRCYHTMDWFRGAGEIYATTQPVLITDQVEGESYKKLINDNDVVEELLVIDGALFKKQSSLGNMWRNLLKLVLLPYQARRLKKVVSKYPKYIIHAHCMYYLALARLAGCKYIGTPQGSEILVRPTKSALYKRFVRYALSGARAVTVDSEKMMRTMEKDYDCKPTIIQNGINVKEIQSHCSRSQHRDKIVSIRAMTKNYRIEKIIESRDESLSQHGLTFCYPFIEHGFKSTIDLRLTEKDIDLGRLEREEMYSLLAEALLVVSVPKSDSSPRSVYEAIFSGCFVATVDESWIKLLPGSMKSRLIIVDLSDKQWLKHAYNYAKCNSNSVFTPCEKALEQYDQLGSIRRIYSDIYKLECL